MYEKFLRAVYGSTTGNIPLVTLDHERKPTAQRWFHYPDEVDRAVRYIGLIEDQDVFLSTSVFTDRQRTGADTKAMAQAVGVDADTCKPENFRLPPSIVVETGPGRWHCWWVLDEPIKAHDATLLAKKIATAHRDQGCDTPQTHSVSKLLRVPNTINTKHDTETESWTIDVVWGDDIYTHDTIEAVYADVALGAEGARQDASESLTETDIDVSVFTEDEMVRLKEYASTSWDRDVQVFEENFVPGNRHAITFKTACNMFRNANLPWSEHQRSDVLKTLEGIALENPGDGFSIKDFSTTIRDASREVGDTLLAMPAWALEMVPDLPPKQVTGAAFSDLETMLAHAGLANLYTSPLKDKETHKERTQALAEKMLQQGMTPPEVFSLAMKTSCNAYDPTRTARVVWSEVQESSQKILVVVDEDPVGRVLVMPKFLSDNEREYLKANPSFVDEYVSWVASQTEAAPTYSYTLAWILLSAVYADRGYIPLRWNRRTPLNLWALILGDTTRTRKTTARRYMTQMLSRVESDLGRKVYLGSDATVEGLAQELGTRDGMTSLISTDEVAGFFRQTLRKTYNVGLMEKFADWYEGEVDASLRATKDKGNKNRVSTQFLFVGVGIREHVALALTKYDFASGFLPRVLWAVADPPDIGNVTEFIVFADDEFVGRDPVMDRLVESLVNRAGLLPTSKADRLAMRSNAETSERLNKFALTAKMAIQGVGDSNILDPSVERLITSVVKAAALLAIHEGSDSIKIRHALFAIRSAEYWFRDMVRMAREVSSSEFERKLNDIEQYILSGKSNMRKEAEIRRKFAMHHPREFDDLMKSLTMQGRIRRPVGASGHWMALEV